MKKRLLLSLLICFILIPAIWTPTLNENRALDLLFTNHQSIALASPADPVNIAVVQFRPQRDKTKNLKRMENYLEDAGGKGAHLVLFPELATTYYPWSSPTGEASKYYRENAELIPQGKTTQMMTELAVKHEMFISWGMVEKAGNSDKLYNSQVLIGPGGEVIAVYRKIHLVPGIEEAIFTSGDQIKIHDTAIGKIAIMICYDRRFPELARTYSLMGAEIILVPAATTDRFIDQYILATRAYENSTWLIFANQVGSQPGGFWGVMHGDSRIIDPDGQTRVMASGDEEEIIWLTIEESEIDKPENLLKRRKPGVYKKVPVLYPPTKDEIVQMVVEEVLDDQIDEKEIYITPNPLPAGTIVKNWTQKIRKLPGKEWLVFINDQPEANWEHPCRYVFVNNVDRTYVVIDANSPPRNLKLEKVLPL